MPKLSGLVARLSRAVPDESKHMTLYGNMEYTTFTCKVCKKKGYVAEAYKESKSKRKHSNQIRPFHATCWNATNGKTRREEDKEVSTTLLSFIIESKK